MAPSIEIVTKYFPGLTQKQIDQYDAMYRYYDYWNRRINMISRKDFHLFYERHILHSLAIAKFFAFKKGMKVLDVGTGGGFPGLPLAVFFPETDFYLVDSKTKKIKMVNGAIEELSLSNARALNDRMENVNGQFDYVTNRAVAPLVTLLEWTKGRLQKSNGGGMICLKGGDLSEEISASGKPVKEIVLSETFDEPFFETKKILFVSAADL